MIRITGGEFRGRMIHAPPHTRTRPTQNKLRQAIFNSLQTVISDAHVLDLYAGSGSLGFEALSRGAQRVTFVENSEEMIQILRKNALTLGVKDQVQIVFSDVKTAWPKLMQGAPYHIVLADPPYEEDQEMRLILETPWSEILDTQGYFCLEWGKQKSKVKELPQDTRFLVKVREKNYGDSILTTYTRKEIELDGTQGDLSRIV